MKKLTKKLTFLTLILLPLLFAAPVNAAHSGNETNGPILELAGKQVIRPGNALTMNMDMPAEGRSEFSVTNLQGKVVWNTGINLASGHNKVKFKIGALAKGVYFLRVVLDGKSATQTFAIQ
ncbi:MAG TPA: T9SS type A sorting domain-containing protein [Bacteroidetes bacterium]|nr:T9SS type A sorting domain-containing protein [Bacteroidota bacterium]